MCILCSGNFIITLSKNTFSSWTEPHGTITTTTTILLPNLRVSYLLKWHVLPHYSFYPSFFFFVHCTTSCSSFLVDSFHRLFLLFSFNLIMHDHLLMIVNLLLLFDVRDDGRLKKKFDFSLFIHVLATTLSFKKSTLRDFNSILITEFI